ncbi:uncharacterized protein LOC132739434 [Ruditapes philippinarum]|uniref:uncharacterized protein LOC132739434 n=1 Tax=Ruditapes philippinarum TaxID=129788 RepID=UPI00295A7677|nr:uncharacterized protein LOC132739434 [Ruditapes philippinarum]
MRLLDTLRRRPQYTYKENELRLLQNLRFAGKQKKLKEHFLLDLQIKVIAKNGKKNAKGNQRVYEVIRDYIKDKDDMTGSPLDERSTDTPVYQLVEYIKAVQNCHIVDVSSSDQSSTDIQINCLGSEAMEDFLKTINCNKFHQKLFDLRRWLHVQYGIESHDIIANCSSNGIEKAKQCLGNGIFTVLLNVDASWEKCLKEKSEDIAEYLISKNIRPTKDQLSTIAITFEGGRKSSVMKKCCGKIIEHIKGISEKIDGVYAAYTINELGKINIAFVLCVKEDIDLRNRVTYEHKVRILGKCNAETREVTFSKTNPKNKVSPNDAKMIKAFIEKKSKTLLQKHRMLSGISAGSIKSKNYGTSEWEKIPCPCIVFYVHAKHFIPIDEDPFENEYDGFAVDVREGAFMRLGRNGQKSSDYQQNVEIAAEVSGCICSGTLSGFLELKDSDNLYGFTCAHIVMPHLLLKKNLDKSSNKSFINQPENSDEVLASIVYQPPKSSEILGKVVKVAYEEGGNGKSGMEIALIELQKSRCPLSGKISDFVEHTFESGLVADRMTIQNDEGVLKFGSASGISHGRIAFDSGIVRELTFPWQNDCLQLILHNQLEVWPINFQERFAKEGDSGAPVFVSRNDELVCLGIVEGGFDCGFCVVTPIECFLTGLGICSLKDFPKISSSTCELCKHLQTGKKE